MVEVLCIKKKQAYKPGSVANPDSNRDGTLSFIWAQGCPYALSAYPPALGGNPYPVRNRDAGLRGISPHRVYLISLQHDLYILSVALVLPRSKFGTTAVSRYASLWCPDFPPRSEFGAIRRPAVQKYSNVDKYGKIRTSIFFLHRLHNYICYHNLKPSSRA